VDEAFSPSHDITQEFTLQNQNSRVAIHASLNFGPGTGGDNEANYRRVHDFLAARASPSTPLQDRIHTIWYCVASEEDRLVGDLERRFFGNSEDSLHAVAPGVPVTLVFTKYDDFVVRVKHEWSKDAEERGLSKVAVSYILRDLATKRFEQEIGERWDEVLRNGNSAIPRVCVSSPDVDEDARSFELLAETALARLRDRSVKLAFAAAQRISAPISTRCECDLFPHYLLLRQARSEELTD
jgi:hypothetical protein